METDNGISVDMKTGKKIGLSEHFYSVQGEGNTAGQPAVFLRFQGCNLMCGGRGTEKDGELHNGATWRCDTIEVWLKGKKYNTEELVNLVWNNYREQIKAGAMIVITGGEPLLHVDYLTEFCTEIKRCFWYANRKHVRIELETNGTLQPGELKRIVDQFNVSPKLENSGMKASNRIKPDVLERFADLSFFEQAIFKFVVSSPKDYGEIVDMIGEYNVPHSQIYLMPASSSRMALAEMSGMVAQLAKTESVNYSPRLQLLLWDKATGV